MTAPIDASGAITGAPPGNVEWDAATVDQLIFDAYADLKVTRAQRRQVGAYFLRQARIGWPTAPAYLAIGTALDATESCLLDSPASHGGKKNMADPRHDRNPEREAPIWPGSPGAELAQRISSAVRAKLERVVIHRCSTCGGPLEAFELHSDEDRDVFEFTGLCWHCGVRRSIPLNGT